MTAVATRPPELRERASCVANSPMSRRQRTGIGGALVVLVIVGAAVRLWGLGSSRLNYDESFTAMAGRLPLGDLFRHLRVNDSHPPLDYLIRAPLARAGVDEFMFRLPSVVCSIGALALFAWWMRRRGRVGLTATALFTVSAFEIIHGREARMYAELELIGVAIAVLADGWLRRPRRWHAPVVGVLVLAGLLTHVSMFLLAMGLLALPGWRSDRAAWAWRGAIAAGGLGWVLLWGSTFLVQARGGHSSWIAPTTPSGTLTALGQLMVREPRLYLAAVVVMVAGSVAMHRRAPALTRVWLCCFAVPVACAVVLGLLAPVMLDRTFTLVAWAPLLALGFALDALVQRSRVIGALGLLAVLTIMVPSTVRTVTSRIGPDAPLRRLQQVARPGDVVAVHTAGKAPEIQWSLGARSEYLTTTVAKPGLRNSFALALGSGPPSGRVWLLDWRHYSTAELSGFTRCAPTWSWGSTRILCLARHRNVHARSRAPKHVR
jgi:hypothetical protein